MKTLEGFFTLEEEYLTTESHSWMARQGNNEWQFQVVVVVCVCGREEWEWEKKAYLQLYRVHPLRQCHWVGFVWTYAYCTAHASLFVPWDVREEMRYTAHTESRYFLLLISSFSSQKTFISFEGIHSPLTLYRHLSTLDADTTVILSNTFHSPFQLATGK